MEAVADLRSGNYKQSIVIFIEILTDCVMEEYYVESWDSFDYDEIIRNKCGRNVSNMTKIFFNINIMMIELTINPIPFYMQV